MKLKNKRTGEIGKILKQLSEDNQLEVVTDNKLYVVKTLAKLNEEWEDYEEPKEYWYIDDFAVMCGTEGEFTTPDLATFTKKDIEKLRAIGNYFETKEEAEKAVEKLKAWKRLKDKGFRFIDHIDRDTGQGMTRYEWNGYIDGEDLDLLFGGEE